VVVGAGVGVVLDRAEVFANHGDTVAMVADAVDVASCPGGAVVGHLHRGDRVYATGKDAAGHWIEIRNPVALGTKVWINAPYLVPDRTVAHLPEHTCSAPVTSTSTTSTTAAAPGATTTTSTTRTGTTAPT